jgi:hypothetical protein
MDRGSATLRRAAEHPTRDDLARAQDDFARALRGMNSQVPPPKHKDFAKVHQKLTVTNLRLSHLTSFSDNERMGYVREAEKQCAHGLDHAARSQNEGRVAQMRFHSACVQAMETALLMDMGSNSGTGTDDLRLKREAALGALSVSLSEMQHFDGMDMPSYEAMARQYGKMLLQTR